MFTGSRETTIHSGLPNNPPHVQRTCPRIAINSNLVWGPRKEAKDETWEKNL